MNRLTLGVVSLAVGLSSSVPAYAFPTTELPIARQSDVIQIRDYGDRGGRIWHGHGHYNHGYSRYNRGYGDYDHDGNAGAIIGGLASRRDPWRGTRLAVALRWRHSCPVLRQPIPHLSSLG